MKTKILGKIVTKNYSAEFEKDDNGVFAYKPNIKVKYDVKFEEIMSIDGDLRFNAIKDKFFGLTSNTYAINISEDTTVMVEKQIYRADVDDGTMFAYTDHIIKTIENNKESAEFELKMRVQEYYTQKIEKDQKILDYCEVHKIDISNADYDKLYSIVYPSKVDKILETEIILQQNGVNLNKNYYNLTNSSDWFSTANAISYGTLSTACNPITLN